MEGMVFDIQKYAIHDGPGIRTSVFLKGCTNNCRWCHNPESISDSVQIREYPNRCIKCTNCVHICPNDAHTFEGDLHIFRRALCSQCLSCVAVCPSSALEAVGKRLSTEAVIEEVLKDRIFYESSGGGITISGGEPLVQSEFTMELLKLAKDNGLHTVLETAGNYPVSRISPLLPLIDILMVDIKIADKHRSMHWCSINWDNVRENILYADKTNDIIVRTPVVGGVNDTIDDIREISKLLIKLKHLLYYELLPYHSIYKSKLSSLGLQETQQFYTPSKSKMDLLCEVAKRMGIPVCMDK